MACYKFHILLYCIVLVAFWLNSIFWYTNWLECIFISKIEVTVLTAVTVID